MIVLTGLIAAAFALVHIAGARLPFLDVVPRSRILSLGSGVSIAYIFVHILPDLAAQQTVFENRGGLLGGLEQHVYLAAMAGLVFFYGLERAIKLARNRTPDGPTQTSEVRRASAGLFWAHILSFAAYNLLIGYLLVHRENKGVQSALLFGVAMSLHFLVTDFGLRKEHHADYDRLARWVLVVAVGLGWLLGVLTAVNEMLVALLFSVLAGSAILNVLKEELPEERQSRFWAFALGAILYSVLLLAL